MADEQGVIPEALERLFDQAFTDGIAAGKSGDDSILAGSSSAYAQAAIRALKPAGDGGEAAASEAGEVERLRQALEEVKRLALHGETGVIRQHIVAAVHAAFPLSPGILASETNKDRNAKEEGQ